jgi:hypothetical protein
MELKCSAAEEKGRKMLIYGLQNFLLMPNLLSLVHVHTMDFLPSLTFVISVISGPVS